jgi:lambda family phage portal protein
MGIWQKLGAYVGWWGTSQSYDAGNYDTRELRDWAPSLLSADDEVFEGRDALVGRSRDLYRNHPVVHGAVNKIVDAIIGSRVLLDAKPHHELLRRDIDWALDWSLGTEAEFKVWGYAQPFDCDIKRERSFGQLMRTLAITRIVDGEFFYILRNKPGALRYTTCIELIDPDRVSNPNGIADNQVLPNGNTVYAGIEFAPDGEPVAYHVRTRHPAALSVQGKPFDWVRVARRSPEGKPIMVHGFRQHRANQKRGVTELASVIKRVKMNDRYDKAELEAALFDAINAGFIRSGAPTGELASAMAPAGNAQDGLSPQDYIDYRKENKVHVEGVRMLHLIQGEDVKFKEPARPAGNYPAFKGAGQHDMAAGMGLSYPQISEDWADINYSSARTLLNEKWRGFESLGEEFTSQACAPAYCAWLEEAIAIGTVRMPGGAQRFYSNRTLISASSWLRPGRGKIDPLKEEQAADIAVHAGRSNTALECANNGLDFYEVLMGKAREDLIRKRLGQAPFVPMKLAEAQPEEQGSNPDRQNQNEREAA